MAKSKAAAEEVVVLEFQKHCTPYAMGDVASFSREMADKYLEAGVATERGTVPAEEVK